MKKHKKLLSLLLCLALTFTMVTVGITAYAQDSNGTTGEKETRDGDTGTSSSGMEISKTATANGDGTYTIQLEAYATGSKVITEVTEDVPTDIVLVLDQSGSMEETMSMYSFREYTNKSNSDYYELRHNGGNNNLYYKLDDGSYVSVSVTVEQGGVTYTAITNGLNNSTRNRATSYWDNRNNLYAVVQGKYQKVTLRRDWVTKYYVYTLPDGTKIAQSFGDRTSPSFSNTDDNKLYLASVDTNKNIYTYSWTDSDGKIHTIGSSTGADTKPEEFTLYERYDSGSKTKLQALKDAVTTFVNNVSEKAKGADKTAETSDDVDHRIAIVGFASTASTDWYQENYENTELLSTQNTVNYRSATSANYRDALVSVNSNGQLNSRLTTAINRLDASGDTYLQYGMDMANKIFEQYPITEDDTSGRQRVVVVFTDGYPAPSRTNNFNYSMADDAISNALTTKTTYKATVYTVGVLDDADPTANIENGFTYNGSSAPQQTVASNRYMHYVSSNYLTASSLKSGGDLNPKADPFNGGESYYLSAGDADTLNNIFQQISDQIESGGSSTTLGEETVIKDFIAQAFTLPEDTTADDITLETYRYTGENQWEENPDAMGATATIDGDEVSVTGFDFAENYVGTVTENGNVSYRGNKLVIKFTVEPKVGFLGGNNVYTNASAGVYENGSAATPTFTFECPQVNVPIKDIRVTPADKNVYLLGDLTGEQLKEGATVMVGDVALDLGRANQNYGLEPWQTNYVNITVKIKDKDGNSIISLDDLTNDKTYSVSVTVSPKTNGNGASGTAVKEKAGEDKAEINVYKPELTFKDSEVYYGDIAPASFTENKTSEVWKHKGSTDEGIAMIGDKPTLEITCTPENGKIDENRAIINTKQDIAVDVAVKIDQEVVTENTVFNHQCSDDKCNVPDNGKFWLHVKTCQLTVTKKGGVAGEPYVFTVYKDDKKYTEVTIVGNIENSSETIYELPVGTYFIKEDTGWSWRFTPTYNKKEVKLSKGAVSDTIICTNEKTKDYWLNGFSTTVVKNVFGTTNN